MKISVFGLGYVGDVTAACLANEGHTVIGVDPNVSKVNLINAGESPIVEPGMPDLLASAVAADGLRATTDVGDAVANSALSFICVGTPSQNNGNLDLQYIERVCLEIGRALSNKADYHVVVVRSTMLPGSMRSTVIPTLEQGSGKTAGDDFGVCINPEFLREGTAIPDYRQPPKTIVGEVDARAGDTLVKLYSNQTAPVIRTKLEVAEMVKYTDNNWHALKVAFANEIGTISRTVGIDGREVMDIFCQDTKLNISPNYMRPGQAFGGSCLPKDVRALNYKARNLDLDLPLLNSIIPSNQQHINRAIQIITACGKSKIGILGLAFKAGTDDLRESPMVDIMERLLGKGYQIKVFDRNVNLAALIGANREMFLDRIPHIAQHMVDSVDEVLQFADTVVIGNGSNEFAASGLSIRRGQRIVDFVQADRSYPSADSYQGICW